MGKSGLLKNYGMNSLIWIFWRGWLSNTKYSDALKKLLKSQLLTGDFNWQNTSSIFSSKAANQKKSVYPWRLLNKNSSSVTRTQWKLVFLWRLLLKTHVFVTLTYSFVTRNFISVVITRGELTSTCEFSNYYLFSLTNHLIIHCGQLNSRRKFSEEVEFWRSVDFDSCFLRWSQS